MLTAEIGTNPYFNQLLGVKTQDRLGRFQKKLEDWYRNRDKIVVESFHWETRGKLRTITE